MNSHQILKKLDGGGGREITQWKNEIKRNLMIIKINCVSPSPLLKSENVNL
ncbi:Uncharacterised protein [Acetobacterium wieringae]|nr:Uncharacterised protein [Acetobacterium wieringae]